MTYLGGKNRLGRRIADVLQGLRKGRSYIEPFVGGAGVLRHIDGGVRVASDIDEDIIEMWRAACGGWAPPTEVSEDQYAFAKERKDVEPHLRGFIKYACSWGGKPWGGYARGNREYARLASAAVLAKVPALQGTLWWACSYDAHEPSDMLIYCDPPYSATTQYSDVFDSPTFWAYMRRWSLTNTVVVSEYTAPEDFRCIAEFPLRNKLNDTGAVERLWMFEGGLNR